MKHPEILVLGGYFVIGMGITQPLIISAHVHPQTFIPMASAIASTIVIGAGLAILLDDLLATFLDCESSTITTFCATLLLSTLAAAATGFAGMNNWLALILLGVGVLVVVAAVAAFILRLNRGAAPDDQY